MIPLHALEQLHTAALHAEHADAIADFRPLGLQIVLDERLRERADVQGRGIGATPIDWQYTVLDASRIRQMLRTM